MVTDAVFEHDRTRIADELFTRPVRKSIMQRLARTVGRRREPLLYRYRTRGSSTAWRATKRGAVLPLSKSLDLRLLWRSVASSYFSAVRATFVVLMNLAWQQYRCPANSR